MRGTDRSALRNPDPQVADPVMNEVDEATEWTDHRFEPLANYDYYELRAGDWRAIVTWNREDDVLVVETVGHRRNVYDRHLPRSFEWLRHLQYAHLDGDGVSL